MNRNEKIAAAKELRAQGLSYAKIGSIVGCDPTTVRQWLNPEAAARNRQTTREWKRRQKQKPKPSKSKARRDALIETAKQLVASGMSQTKAGKLLGVHGSTVSEWTHTELADLKEQRLAQAKEMRAAGLSYDAIGRELGVTGQAVRYWLRDDKPTKPDLPPFDIVALAMNPAFGLTPEQQKAVADRVPEVKRRRIDAAAKDFSTCLGELLDSYLKSGGQLDGSRLDAFKVSTLKMVEAAA